jgi:predicted amidohydrolase
VTPLRTIAAAQTIPVGGDVAANLEQHLRLVDVAAEAGPQVLLFPELSLTGYELDLADELAFSLDDPRLGPLALAAASRSMTLIVGAPVRVGARLYLGALIVSPDRTVALYTKHHLGAFSPSVSPDGVVPPAEATVFVPGDANPLVRLGGHTAAVAVCADTGRASHVQQAAERGATTYLASVFVIPADLERETATLRAYAARHAMCVARANFGGPSGGLASAGQSAIWSDTGEPLAWLESAGAGVVVARESRAGWRARTIALARSRSAG